MHDVLVKQHMHLHHVPVVVEALLAMVVGGLYSRVTAAFAALCKINFLQQCWQVDSCKPCTGVICQASVCVTNSSSVAA